MKAVGITDIGRCRKNNEDAYYVAEEGAPMEHLYLVADGMGGCNAGEVASSGAIRAFLRYVEEHREEGMEIPDLIAGGFQAANQDVFRQSNSASEFAEMGTTMVAAVIKEDRVYIAYVGDSRAYLMRQGSLEAVTTDHSYVMELVKMGTITKEEAAKHPKRNIITRAVGIKDTVEIDTVLEDVQAGDMLLLCTDGLSGMLRDEEMEAVLRAELPLEKKAQKLVALANEHGGYDNISLVLIEI
ncbi:Stp1/IreP family PP2C-type Ser/Thr phosphatase [Anaerotignum lactatifermentans]|uniref:Stp1/IreP family PP2C-type Ser/Thr phosphatase n=1 Tax=Anaerotignum lactatifermentans TaxID=160404 RepID=A0ABS2GB86_9FIRM|nr:Stp1/IreP family PP2C-type Ser/Thr phosphatase [Anaerotignum lactatifermentans]MBM6830154.1 Stp1/IreP family PP2C-type Ser/Thr phosphatase [Anaerotignum lactatifermentans]MBM6878701.1 Stp1/IreP family PP2C-type Ser/Thr phosphatase [Anaerotignum lactatifermentans]MBM6951767.1 Stp1/IreP family PP2C-type Ser/Thr phosphatase [Anaerotignum lactatifermentans]